MTITLQDILATFGAIACIGGGTAYVFKMIAWLNKPNTIQTKLLQEHAEELQKQKKFLDKDNERLNCLEEQNRLIMQSLFALLSHGIDGNDIQAMKESKAQIQEYLIQK